MTNANSKVNESMLTQGTTPEQSQQLMRSSVYSSASQLTD